MKVKTKNILLFILFLLLFFILNFALFRLFFGAPSAINDWIKLYLFSFFIINTVLFTAASSLICLTAKFRINALYRYLINTEINDNLSTLPNVLFFNQHVNKSIQQAKRNKKILAILLVDIDHFGTLEPNEADKILKEIGIRCASNLRGGDTIAHFKTDKFVILLDVVHFKFAGLVADKLLTAIKKDIKVNEHTVNMTVSIGISIFPHDSETFADLLIRAHQAVNMAKESGGDTFQYHEQKMYKQAHDYIKLEHALRQAIKKNELRLFFQPQMHVATRQINSAEALIRWQHPEYGILSPDIFISIAEETGIILEIGEWAIFEACRINKSWQDLGYPPLRIAVNISAKQFMEQDILRIIKQALHDSGLKPQYLEVEITETAMMDDLERAILILHQIEKLGIKITIDDFGTGYTSINYLRQFPVSILKIDKTFIDGIPNKPHDAAITSAVITLGHHLSLEVVAEGVETKEQLEFLKERNCDLVQGDLICAAIPPDELLAKLEKQKA